MSVAEAVAELEGATVKPPTVEEARAALEAKEARQLQLEAQRDECTQAVQDATKVHKEKLRAARIDGDAEAAELLPAAAEDLRAKMRELADAEEAVHINAAEEIPAAKAALAAAERRADQGQYTEGAGRRGKLARRIDGQMDRLVTSLREREEIVAEMQRLARRLGMGFDARNRFALPNFIREALRPFDSSLGLADAKDRGKTFHELERGFCKPPTWPETEREEL